MAWLFGGTVAAKCVLFLLVALGAGAAIWAAKANYDRNRRNEGKRAVQDQLDKETNDARKRADEAARKFRSDGNTPKRMRDGTF